MSKIDLISGRWSELVFDGRNKQYGAYVLRQETGKRNLWSMLAILLLGLAIWGGLTLKNIADEAAARRLAQEAAELSALEEAEAQKEEKKEPEVERQELKQEEVQQEVEQVKSSVAFQVPEIKPDELVKNEVKSQDEIMEKDEAIGTADVVGNNEDAEILHVAEAIKNEPVQEVVEEKPVVKEEPPVVEDKVFEVVEQQPSFPGGASALMQYLASNIKYPVVAQENGVQGRVIVGFVVDKDGSITNVQVLRGVDPSLDKEAERVVKAMPKWIPGKQNGQNVKVKFNVPVSFKLQ